MADRSLPTTFDLTGHVALVTGGNSGIGLGMADALAAHGASVAIWGTNAEKNERARAQLSAHGGAVLDLVCDVGDHAAVTTAFAETIAALGRVDSCFVNAGVGGQAPSFVGMTEDEWHRVLRVNLDGAFYTAQEAVRHMAARHGAGDTAGGSVVFTTSGSAYFGQQRGQHYGGSKAAVVAMMKGIAVEHARHGIRCNAVLPGFMDTPLIHQQISGQYASTEAMVAERGKSSPTGKMGTGWDIAKASVFLASDDAGYINGVCLPVDGGAHCRISAP